MQFNKYTWNPLSVSQGRKKYISENDRYNPNTELINQNIINSQVLIDLSTWSWYSQRNFRELSFYLGAPTTNHCRHFQHTGEWRKSSGPRGGAQIPIYDWVSIVLPFTRKLVVISDSPHNFSGPSFYFENWESFLSSHDLNLFPHSREGIIQQLFDLDQDLDDRRSYWLRIQSKAETPTHYIVNYVFQNGSSTWNFEFFTLMIRKRFQYLSQYGLLPKNQRNDIINQDWNYDLQLNFTPQKIKVGVFSPFDVTGQNFETETNENRTLILDQDPNYLKTLPIPRKDIDFRTAKYVKKFFLQTFVWGIEGHENLIFYSDYDNYCYFPENNVIELSKSPEEKIQDIVFFQNSVLIVITNQSIYMIKQVLGTNKEFYGFQTIKINSNIGTSFRKSVKTIGAYVYFIGTDLRVYRIKSLYNTTPDEKFNLELVDKKITNFIKPLLLEQFRKKPNRLFTISHNLEYQIYFDKYCFRYYTERERNSWTYDESLLFLDVVGGDSWQGDLYLITKDKIFIQDENFAYDDKDPVELVLTTPEYGFFRPMHKKTFKKTYLNFGEMKWTEPVSLQLNIKIDDKIVEAGREDVLSDVLGTSYSLNHVLKDNVVFSGLTGKAGDNFTLGDNWYPANEKDLEYGKLDKHLNQQKIYTSGRGYTFQTQLVYNQEPKFELRSIAAELKVKKVK